MAELLELPSVFPKKETDPDKQLPTALKELPPVFGNTREEEKELPPVFSGQKPAEAESNIAVTDYVATEEEGRIEGDYKDKYSSLDYSEDDLVQDEFYAPIERYMTTRYGSHMADEDKYSRRDVVEMFLNNMRGFAAGNTVRAVNEVSYLYSIEDQNELEAIAEGYALYENLPNIFSGKLSVSEGAEVVQDFVRSTILDPSNLIGGVIGWVVGGAGTKAGTKVAMKAAQKVYQKELAKGVAKTAAKDKAKKEFGKILTKTQLDTAAALSARRAGVKAAQTVSERLATKGALKNIMSTTAYDAAVNVGTDYLYQQAMIDTENQDEYSISQSAIAGIGAFLMGGIQAGSVALRGTNAGALTHEAISATRDPKKVFSGLSETVEKLAAGATDSWNSKVMKGKTLEEIPQAFWVRFLAGDDTLDTDGIVNILLKEGYGFQPRFEGDKASNWIADWIKANPENMSVDFIKKFNDEFGTKIGTDVDSVEKFANVFASEMSGSGQIMGTVGRFSKGKKVTGDVNIQEYMKQAFGIDSSPSLTRSEKLAQRGEAWSEALAKFQSTTIRAIVANLGTTWLNVGGYTSATVLNSASDIAMGAGYMLSGGVKKIAGADDAVDLMKKGAQLWRANGQRVRNLIDPTSTLDDYKSFVISFPDQMRDLDFNLAGGVDRFAKQLDVDVAAGRINRSYEAVVDAASMGNMVYAQDVLTKSQEFMYQIDKAVRIKFGKSYAELLKDPNFSKITAEAPFKEAVGKAAYETNRAIFSQTMRSERGIGEIAGMIEDFRRLPGIGITIPFGRFFNNTVAFMSDHSGLSVVAKHMGMDVQRGSDELFARAAVTYGMIGTMAIQEKGFIEKGYDWYESDDITGLSGSVQDHKYNFPYSALKAAARLTAIYLNGETPTADQIEDIRNNVAGQLTRDLTDAEEGLVNIVDSMLDGSFFEDMSALEAGGTLASNWVSAGTRFLEPINEAIGVAQGYDFTQMDRKQGVEWINESVRYIDNALALVGLGPERNQKYTATTGPQKSNRGKLTTFLRETLGQTDTEKMFNRVGIADWKKNMYSESGKASNRYNEIFNRTVEAYASRLIRQSDWNSMDQDARLARVRAVLKRSADMTKKLMKTNVLQSGDRELELILKMSAQGSQKLNDAMKEMEEITGEELKLEEMEYDQLLKLETYMKYDDDIDRMKTRHWMTQ